MWNFFSSMLSGWQWFLLCLVPPAILALYFLKLRRQPLEVPSTYLWQRTLEDMHVNSLWQRLRQNILLLLQLLLVALLMIACLRPSWEVDRAVNERSIIMVDTSASMVATDVRPTRLDEAKRRALEVIKQMRDGDAAMIISFSDRARVEQPFTTNRRKLERRIAAVQPTQRTTDISEGLRAAGGRANPGRSADAPMEDSTTPITAASVFADPLPADVYIFSDGGFSETPDFSWGNLNPKYIPIGTEQTPNVGILAFSVAMAPLGEEMQAFAQVKNFGEIERDLVLELELSTDEAGRTFQVIDAVELAVPSGEVMGAEFGITAVDNGILRLRITEPDDFVVDDVAFAAINPGNKAEVLLVTDGNEALETVLGTGESAELAQVRVTSGDTLSQESYLQAAAAGVYDLIVFDNCVPQEMPNTNTIFLGDVPAGARWTKASRVEVPQIIDTDLTHPLMNYLDFGDVNLVYANPVEGPLGSQVLIDTDLGAIAVVAPREGYEDVVLGFGLLYEENGERYANTDWPRRLSFPLFFRNALHYLGNVERRNELLSIQPGTAISFSAERLGERREVTSPTGLPVPLKQVDQASYSCLSTDETGVYAIRGGTETAARPLRFAVNLFDETESDLGIKPAFETTWREVKAQRGFETTRRELWPWIVVLAVVVLLAEWYVYNQRVFV